jgi:hypothetical protein
MPQPNEQNPFEGYNILDRIAGIPLGTAISSPLDSLMHLSYTDTIPQRITRERPRLYDELGGRVDRNQIDMMTNFMGAYDWMARMGDDPQNAIEAAKSYQYKSYADRPQDSIMDFYENKAGINAFDPSVGRVDDATLIDMAERYALDRIKASNSQEK